MEFFGEIDRFIRKHKMSILKEAQVSINIGIDRKLIKIFGESNKANFLFS